MNLWVFPTFEPDEIALCLKTGATPIPGTSLALNGGKLLLTNKRLCHCPLEMRRIGKLDARFLKDADVSFGLTSLPKLLASWSSKVRALRLEDITEVVPCRKSSIRVTSRDGKSREYLVGATGFAPVWSNKNIAHRDEMITAVREAISRISKP